MKIMSFNVGIWSRNWKKSDPFFWIPRMKAMKKMLKDQDPDVVCFQELWFPATLFIPGNYRKVLGSGLEHPIYVKKGTRHGLGKFRIHWSECVVEGVKVFSVHGHWTEKIYKKIFESLKKEYGKDSRPAVLTGDWNVDLNTIKVNAPELVSAREELGRLEQDTYIHFHDHSRRGELDHFMNIGVEPKDFEIVNDAYGAPKDRISDHYPINMVI